MVKAVALLFLLDSLPDFNNVINSTLHTFIPDINVGSCNPTITAPVLEVIGRKLGLTADSVERLKNIESPNDSHDPSLFRDLSPERPDYTGTFQDDSTIQESNSLEKAGNLIEYNYVDNVINNNEDASECEISRNDFFKSYHTLNASKKVSYPESAPFLAAIFETVSNVTAQTCGGALLSPHWVLTAASCINVLSPFYSNLSHQINTYYTIVVGATNPLKDGTVHNVSEIILHPAPKVVSNLLNDSSSIHYDRPLLNSKTVNGKTPSLALMRIEPGLEKGMLPMMEKRTDWDGVNAKVYGWAMVQNVSGVNTMLATSLPVEVQSPAKCERVYGTPEQNITLCLSMNETSASITRMNSGGPVVIIQDGQVQLLGVGLTDGGSPLQASPIAAHHDWLRKVIGTRV